MWGAALWFGIIGAFTFIHRLYNMNIIILTYMSLGIGIPILWTILQIAFPNYTSNPTIENHMVIFTVTVFYLSTYFFCIGTFMLIDLDFATTSESLVNYF